MKCWCSNDIKENNFLLFCCRHDKVENFAVKMR